MRQQERWRRISPQTLAPTGGGGIVAGMKATFMALLAFSLCLGVGCATAPRLLPEDIPSLKALAEEGDAEAQFQLANNYYIGEGVEEDYAQSFKWASRSAAQDNPKAKYRLGSLYIQGRGVPKDENKAKALFKESKIGLLNLADRNDPQARAYLGVMYQRGVGVEKDEKEAVKWYRKAAEQGDALAQYNLGWMYANGRGVEEDEKEAVKWYRKAAEQNDAEAQYNLGVMYATGRGVEKDRKEAVKWLRKAAEQGYEPAKAALKRLSP
jgi:hypothetical protein